MREEKDEGWSSIKSSIDEFRGERERERSLIAPEKEEKLLKRKEKLDHQFSSSVHSSYTTVQEINTNKKIQETMECVAEKDEWLGQRKEISKHRRHSARLFSQWWERRKWDKVSLTADVDATWSYAFLDH